MSRLSSPLSPAHTQPNSDDDYIPHLHSSMPSPIVHRHANPNPTPPLGQELDESSQSSSSPTRRSDTPIGRSNGSTIGTNTRTGLMDLHQRVYGSQPLCLVTQAASSCEVAHCVAKASKAWDVSHALTLSVPHLTFFKLTLYEYCLGFGYRRFHVHSRRNLFYRASISIACIYTDRSS